MVSINEALKYNVMMKSKDEMKRAFKRLIKHGIGASEAHDIAMAAASGAGYSM